MFLIHYKKYEYDVFNLDTWTSESAAPYAAHVGVSSINAVVSSVFHNLGVCVKVINLLRSPKSIQKK